MSTITLSSCFTRIYLVSSTCISSGFSRNSHGRLYLARSVWQKKKKKNNADSQIYLRWVFQDIIVIYHTCIAKLNAASVIDRVWEGRNYNSCNYESDYTCNLPGDLKWFLREFRDLTLRLHGEIIWNHYSIDGDNARLNKPHIDISRRE